jgi:hypothetical protein
MGLALAVQLPGRQALMKKEDNMRVMILRFALAALIVAVAGCAKYPVVSSPSASVPTASAPSPAR